ncbi:hypothetical protein [Candidatus Methylomirabilis limnetica]|jgi:hypothetical protein|uniref:hypothetical protein n=1 Tax=Candidatus Methylomirabilis limnetica TaxID=2033718 RepID=UPI001057435C|nr:hypothetical protein [Candidatus Methylomirabilis limnetica]
MRVEPSLGDKGGHGLRQLWRDYHDPASSAMLLQEVVARGHRVNLAVHLAAGKVPVVVGGNVHGAAGDGKRSLDESGK